MNWNYKKAMILFKSKSSNVCELFITNTLACSF